MRKVQWANCSSSGRMLSLEHLSELITRHLAVYSENEGCCQKWAVGESTLGGRGLIAAEDIAAGQTLFVDHPLIHGPRAGHVIQQGCTVCGKVGDSVILFTCTDCNLLLCSTECQTSNMHSSDCAIISNWENKIPIQEIDSISLSKALTPIRALLLDEDQKQVMSALQAHRLPQHSSEIRKLKEYFEIPPDDEELMTIASCALDTNAFEIANSYNHLTMSTRGLYPVAGLMNHSCVSNTRYGFNKQSRMIVKATKAITAGSEIVTCYSGFLWGTPARRTHLYKTKHFLCTCDRCADPLERGTMLAALKCLSLECPGSLLPVEPLKMSSPWQCLDCSMRIPAKTLGAIQSAIGSLLGTVDFENVTDLENFVQNRILKYIPKSNQIVMDLECRLIWAFGVKEGVRWHELSEDRLSLKEQLCRRVLDTLAALAAGDAHLRGLMLYHLHATLAERARRAPDLYEELKAEIESTIEQAYNILHEDISAPPDLELRRQYLGPDSNKPHEEKFFILTK